MEPVAYPNEKRRSPSDLAGYAARKLIRSDGVISFDRYVHAPSKGQLRASEEKERNAEHRARAR